MIGNQLRQLAGTVDTCIYLQLLADFLFVIQS